MEEGPSLSPQELSSEDTFQYINERKASAGKNPDTDRKKMFSYKEAQTGHLGLFKTSQFDVKGSSKKEP